MKYEQEENLVEIEFLEVIIFNSTCKSINANRNKFCPITCTMVDILLLYLYKLNFMNLIVPFFKVQ